MPQFPRGSQFPNEGFVQNAIEAHVTAEGYVLLQEGFTDLACRHPETGKRWVIEAKGHSSSVGVDFNTCLGQILKRMADDETASFGLAMPATPQYQRQMVQVSRRVRKALDLHWILVDESGAVTVLGPDALIPG